MPILRLQKGDSPADKRRYRRNTGGVLAVLAIFLLVAGSPTWIVVLPAFGAGIFLGSSLPPSWL